MHLNVAVTGSGNILSKTTPIRLTNTKNENPDYRELHEAYSTKGLKSVASARMMPQPYTTVTST